MFGKQAYKPPPPRWTRRALSHLDCSEFSQYVLPAVGWVVQGNPDAEWLAATYREMIKRRAPFLRGRLARSESGSPKYEVHVPPLDDTEIETLRVTESTTNDPLGYTIPFEPHGSTKPLAKISPSGFDPGILNPQTKVSDGIEGYIKRNDPLILMHITRAPDGTAISFCWPHCLFDGFSFAQLMQAWGKVMSGKADEIVSEDALPTKPENYYDFLSEVKVEPGWAPYGWIPATTTMWARAIYSYLKRRYFYQPQVYSTIVFPKWLIDQWKVEAKKELPEGKYVSSNDLAFAWVAKHSTTPYPADEKITLLSTICLRLRLPQLPQSTITNTAGSYILPDNFSIGELQNLSVSQIAYAFRKATEFYYDTDNVLKELAWEYKRLIDHKGGRSMMPLVHPNQRFLIVDSLAGMGIEKMDFTSRGPDGRGSEVKTLTTFVCYGDGIQMLTNDHMGGYRFFSVLPQVCFESMKAALERDVGITKAKL